MTPKAPQIRIPIWFYELRISCLVWLGSARPSEGWTVEAISYDSEAKMKQTLNITYVLTNWWLNNAVVDNIPKVNPEKLDKLMNILNKILSQVGTIREGITFDLAASSKIKPQILQEIQQSCPTDNIEQKESKIWKLQLWWIFAGKQSASTSDEVLDQYLMTNLAAYRSHL